MSGNQLLCALFVAAAAVICAGTAAAELDMAAREEAYRAAFEARFPKVRTVAEGRKLVTAAHYDAVMLEERLPGLLGLTEDSDKRAVWSQAYDYLLINQDHVTNDRAAMAWGLSYDHLSLNQMARATGDAKYLAASWLVARAVADARDTVRGLKLYTGVAAPVWGCSKYVKAGRAAHPVHTGVIAFPVLELLTLLRGAPEYENKPTQAEQDEMLAAMRAALAFHDAQFCQGPAGGEGYYVGANQEESINGVALPANRQSAMGRALWLVYELAGDADARDKALRIGRFLKRRLSVAADKNAYAWPYSILPGDKAKHANWETLLEGGLRGEDISHGSLTASFPMILHRAGEVFGADDAQRFANTVTGLFAREDDGVLYTHVAGWPRDDAHPGLLVLPGRWLRIAPDDADAYRKLEAFIVTRNDALRPLDLANLIRYRPNDAAKGDGP